MARPLPAVRAEVGLFAGLALWALGARLWGLGEVLLEPAEAVEAVAAWCVAQAAPCATTQLGTSPLLFTANLLAFGLLTASDLWVRWLPVLSGALLVAVAFALRRALGRGAAAWAALLMACSATLLYFGRHLSPDALGATLAALAWASLAAEAQTGEARWPWVAAAVAALAVCAGSGAWTVFFALALWELAAWGWGGRLPLRSFLSPWWKAIRARPGRARGAFLAGGVALVLTATAFTLRFAGVGLAADLLANWFTRFGETPTYPWHWVPRLLLLQEPLILFGGLAGLALAARRRDPLGLFLGWWAGFALLVGMAAGGRAPDDLVAVAIPLALLAGQALDAFLRHLRERGSWAAEGGFALFAGALGVFGYVQMAAYSLTGDPRYLILTGVPVVVILGLVVLWWAWHGQGAALRGLACFALLWAAVAGLAVAGNLNYHHEPNRFEGFVAEQTTRGMQDLVTWLQRLSVQRQTDPHALPVTVAGYDRPILRWYLREFRDVRFVPGLAAPPEAGAVLAPADRELPLGETFTGQDFQVVQRGLPGRLRG
ncbi:MAG: glycosyltransferase family 39 protein, partial [Anaerolineae bacterium]|nr:glycosyltransferase family 39 protein [Anaerolineae bacterium]